MKTPIPVVWYTGLPTRLALWMMCADRLAWLTEKLRISRKPQLASAALLSPSAGQEIPRFTRPPYHVHDLKQRGEHIAASAVAARQFGTLFPQLRELAFDEACYSAMELGMSDADAGHDRLPPAAFGTEPDLVIAWITGYECGLVTKARLTRRAHSRD